MTLLKLWFAATAILLGALFLYEFAPIVLFLLAVTAILGAMTFVIVSIARAYERKRMGSDPNVDS